jgi:hypothetical protein
MEQVKFFRFWINAPRFVMIIIFVLAIVGKITSPGAFFTMINALNPPLFATETLYSLLITTEIVLIGLLIFKPDTGIIWSAVLLLFFTIGIGVLHAVGIRELCGCFGDFLVNEIGPAKILQNTGLALLLFSSWKARKTG